MINIAYSVRVLLILPLVTNTMPIRHLVGFVWAGKYAKSKGGNACERMRIQILWRRESTAFLLYEVHLTSWPVNAQKPYVRWLNWRSKDCSP
jgi:hypothetical protein